MTPGIKTCLGLPQYGKGAPNSRKSAIGAWRHIRIACAEQTFCGHGSNNTQVRGLFGQQPLSHCFCCWSLGPACMPTFGACGLREIQVSNPIQPQPYGINVHSSSLREAACKNPASKLHRNSCRGSLARRFGSEYNVSQRITSARASGSPRKTPKSCRNSIENWKTQ